MQRQFFKSVYFADLPAPDPGRRNLKLAFSERDLCTYNELAVLSSYELRSILGTQSFQDLRLAAQREGLPLNTYCIRTLREWLVARQADLEHPSFPLLENARIHTTFRAGKSAPLHRWYPFLEGYSPHYVEQIILRFAPRARRILDPFAGVGTTPLAAASLGREAFFCEINPLLQFLVDAKIRALILPARDRNRTVAALEALADRLPRAIETAEPDATLPRTYSATFGSSKFFGADTFNETLRARTLLDRLACDDPSLAQFATVAALATLVPSSYLRRAGDLRFRRGKEFEEVEDFVHFFQRQLRIVAEDLAAAVPIESAPVFVVGDAQRLRMLPPLELDAVVTSPPYLNGTNYFRNTKIELWFLRSLWNGNDLAAFRRLSVTAGINDVTRDKARCSHPAVCRVVEALERTAYDRRIPQMVSNYFHDMECSLASIGHHLVRGALVAVDIGDSIYANTHVPTDRLIAEVAEPMGFNLEQSVLLRSRISRDTSPLKQVLLIFRYEPPLTRPSPPISRPSWSEGWAQFKGNLPHHDEPFAKRNWGHPLHSLCSYQGKMKPSLAHHLIQTFVPRGGRVLDPFAGVGTIPFEAALQGITAYGFEISPAAAVIAGAKLGRTRREEVEAVLSALAERLCSAKPSEREKLSAKQIRFNSELEEYFHPRTLEEILLARQFFRLHRPDSASHRLVMASLLHILHGNRPYSLSRRSHPITPFSPTGPKEYRPLIPRLREKVERGLEAALPLEFVEGKIFECDATLWWPQEVDQLDAVITSPPFFDSTRFHLANWMRLWFAGWERSDFDARPRSFVDERQKISFRVYEPVFRQARERLRPGGVVVLHLGRSIKCDMAAKLEEFATPWFRVVDRFLENVEHCESHGIRDKGTVTAHQFLVLK
jgi:tRNA G10  N-methylase Trm11